MSNFNEKSRLSYNQKADNYDNSPEGRFTFKFRRFLLSSISVPANTNVLDVACSTGSFLSALNQKTPIKGFGIDISDRMVDNARALNPGMEFRVSGCELIPFDDNFMDIITVCAAYHHFPNPPAFAKEAKRVLKPGGSVYIADIYLPFIIRTLVNPFVPLSSAGDVKFYSPKEITQHFERFGFATKDIKISGYIQIISVQKRK